MADIIERLQEANRKWLLCDPKNWDCTLLDAADQIDQMRSKSRFHDAVIRSGNVAALTEAERQAVVAAAESYDSNDGDDECERAATALTSLLYRLSPPRT